MNRNDILKNGSGYTDYTAFKAIMNTEGGSRMDIQAGEIYEAKRTDGRFMEVVIVAVHEDTCCVLQLSDKATGNYTRVICQGEKYTDTNRINYVFNKNLRRFLRTLTEEEFAEIIEKVEESLGFEKIKESLGMCEEKAVDAEEWLAQKIKTEEYEKTIFDLTTEKESLLKENTGLKNALKFEVGKASKNEESQKLEIERDFYKEMYEKLLEKVIA